MKSHAFLIYYIEKYALFISITVQKQYITSTQVTYTQSLCCSPTKQWTEMHK